MREKTCLGGLRSLRSLSLRKMYPMGEDIVKRMEGVNDPEDWSPCSGCLFYKHLDLSLIHI